MTEFIIMTKAYFLLTTAIIQGGSLHEATPDYFEAICIIEGYEVQGCAYLRQQGIIDGLFPMDLSGSVTSRAFSF